MKAADNQEDKSDMERKVTDGFKTVIEYKDHLLEILNNNRRLAEEKSRKIEQF